MTATAKFWNKAARKYAESPVRQQAAYEAKLAHTQTFFTPETRLFEFACGTGSTALHHAPKVAEVLATDLSDEMITIAREKLAKTDLANVRFETWNIEADPITEDGFDMVMAHSILHLVHDLPQTLKTVQRLLKPGGVFVSSTVCLSKYRFIASPVLGMMRLMGQAPYVSMLKREKLETGGVHHRAKSVAIAGNDICSHHWRGACWADGGYRVRPAR